MIKQLQFFIIVAIIAVSCNKPTVYYVDSIAGNDNNNGQSLEEPFASVQKINNLDIKPGDKILFKRGSNFKGQLVINKEGTISKPIVYDSYGSGSLPVIEAFGIYSSAIKIVNTQNITLSNIRVTNNGRDRKPRRYGVHIIAHNYGESKNITLHGIEVHNVNGSLVKDNGGGAAIYWHNSGDSVLTRFVNLTIEKCHIVNCGRNGIISDGYTNRKQWFPSLGVVVRNNVIEGVPGDGIVPIGCDGALIEYNIMRNCPDILSHNEAAAGIWPWSCDNTVIQYNEVAGHNAKWDGQGFDSDWNCINTIIQYNYSHDNAGGFLLVCNKGDIIGGVYNAGTVNTLIANNISINDGLRPYKTERAGWFSPTIHISGPCYGTKFYNNIIIVPRKPNPNIDHTFLKTDNWGGPWPDTTLFESNYIITASPLNIDFGKGENFTFMYNFFYGNFITSNQLVNIYNGKALPQTGIDLYKKMAQAFPHIADSLGKTVLFDLNNN